MFAEAMRQSQLEALVGPPGPRGPAGQSGKSPSEEELRRLIREELIGILKTEQYRGERGSQGEPGRDSHVPGPAGPRGLAGESITGPAGRPGRDGKAAQIEVGTVAVGDAASVKNVGDSNHAVLEIVLPKPQDGKDGKDGAPGKDGVTVDGLSELEIRKIVIDALSAPGLLTKSSAKLVRIRGMVKKWIKAADARHQDQIGKMIRAVDNVFDEDL